MSAGQESTRGSRAAIPSAQARFPFGHLVPKTFPLNQTQQAFEYAKEQRP